MYELRPATQDDYAFTYDLLVAAMKEYVDQTWGWEDSYQQERFCSKFDPATYQIIVLDGRDVGALSVVRNGHVLYLSEIQINPDYQRQGLGTAIVLNFIQ
jgi:GNAT superfamily N-acetyltransferase